jgi:hypothetical protein
MNWIVRQRQEISAIRCRILRSEAAPVMQGLRAELLARSTCAVKPPGNTQLPSKHRSQQSHGRLSALNMHNETHAHLAVHHLGHELEGEHRVCVAARDKEDVDVIAAQVQEGAGAQAANGRQRPHNIVGVLGVEDVRPESARQVAPVRQM